MAIRQVPPGIKDTNLANFLRELRSAVGGVSDQVTKLVQTRSSSSSGGGGGGGDGGGTDPGTNPPITPGGDGYPPPAPLSLVATADVWAINLAWSNPVIADYLGTEIWARRTFPAWSSATRYYVNAKVLFGGVVYRAKKGNDASGTAAVNNTNFTPSSSADWWESTTLTVMADRVKVAEVAGLAYTFTGLTSELLTPGETWAFWVRNRDIEDLYSTYFPNDDVGVSATTLLDPGAMIDLLTGAIKDTQLYKDLGDRIDLIDGTGPGSVNARITTESTARVDGDTSLASQITTLSAQQTNTSAALQTEITTRANADSALSSSITTLQTTVNGHTTSIQTNATSINGLQAQYTVKIDNNGWVSGFGLASTPVNGVPFSDFIVRVDRFSIAQPSSPDAGYQSDPTIPFIVTTGSSTINGETVPAGTYIKDAYIQNGTITTAKIGNATITNAKIGNTIFSTAFDGDVNNPVTAFSSTGWALNKNGQAVFNNVRVRGDVLLGSTNVVSNNPSAYGTPNEWIAFYNTTAGVFYSAPTLGLEYSFPSGGANLRLYYAANSTAPSTDPWSQALIRRPGTASDYVPVVGGRSYQFSAWTGAVNCSATLYVYIYDVNFNYIGLAQSGNNASERAGSSVLNEANWKLLSVTGALGAAAAYVRLVFHRWGPTDRTQISYARFTRPFFSEVPADYTYIIPWSPGGISLLDTLALRANAATVVEYVAPGTVYVDITTAAANAIKTVTGIATLPVATVDSAYKRLVYFNFELMHYDGDGPGYIQLQLHRNGAFVTSRLVDPPTRILDSASNTAISLAFTLDAIPNTSETFRIDMLFISAAANTSAKWWGTASDPEIRYPTLTCFTSKR